jgi:hypothetical protein
MVTLVFGQIGCVVFSFWPMVTACAVPVLPALV